jgi:hypothetical protein
VAKRSIKPREMRNQQTLKAGVRGRAEIKMRARVRVPLFCVFVDEKENGRDASVVFSAQILSSLPDVMAAAVMR